MFSTNPTSQARFRRVSLEAAKFRHPMMAASHAKRVFKALPPILFQKDLSMTSAAEGGMAKQVC